MAYLALYRKWRPRTFTEVVGQKHISIPLQRAIEQDRLAHGKKPLKNKNDYQPPASGGNSSENLEASEEIPSGVKTQKSSITDPESG